MQNETDVLGRAAGGACVVWEFLEKLLMSREVLAAILENAACDCPERLAAWEQEYAETLPLMVWGEWPLRRMLSRARSAFERGDAPSLQGELSALLRVSPRGAAQ